MAATLSSVRLRFQASVRIVQGVLLHAFWTAEYGGSLSPERSDERH